MISLLGKNGSWGKLAMKIVTVRFKMNKRGSYILSRKRNYNLYSLLKCLLPEFLFLA